MKREERLRTQADFDRVFNHGRSFANRLAVLYVLATPSEHNRVGFVVSKRLGNAVSRNRFKRRYREAFRALWPRIRKGHDMIVLPRAAGREVNFELIQEALRRVLRQAGLYVEEL